MNVTIKETERIDELNGRGYRIIQDRSGFCFGIDAVLLSSFAIVKEGDHVLDLGTGTGVIPILLEAKTKGAHFTGLELQEEVAEMARRSVRMNELEEKVDIVTGDLREAVKIFGKSSFSVITSNPPYMPYTGGLVSPNEKKAISRTELKCTLSDVISQAAALLVSGGRFYMVHRPSRLSEIMVLMQQNGLAVRYMRLVYPSPEKDANLVLIEGIRGARHQVVVEKPCIVYEKPGVYHPEMHEIYFHEQLMDHELRQVSSAQE
jgi:tRNA1(Val) A37 N6-methylase TrmN6